MPENPHYLDQAHCADNSCKDADEEFDDNESPCPIEIGINEERESQVAEHESFQSKTDHLEGGTRKDFALGGKVVPAVVSHNNSCCK